MMEVEASEGKSGDYQEADKMRREGLGTQTNQGSLG